MKAYIPNIYKHPKKHETFYARNYIKFCLSDCNYCIFRLGGTTEMLSDAILNSSVLENNGKNIYLLIHKDKTKELGRHLDLILFF